MFWDLKPYNCQKECMKVCLSATIKLQLMAVALKLRYKVSTLFLFCSKAIWSFHLCQRTFGKHVFILLGRITCVCFVTYCKEQQTGIFRKDYNNTFKGICDFLKVFILSTKKGHWLWISQSFCWKNHFHTLLLHVMFVCTK